MIIRMSRCLRLCSLLAIAFALASVANASRGDRLPEFQDCLEICKQENCGSNGPPIPLLHRLLLWDCPSECDQACQHITTSQLIATNHPVEQYHGKWPFYRFLGAQEPASVIFSILNLLAHQYGRKTLVDSLPATYVLRHYYEWISFIGMFSWIASTVFHTRDFRFTEQLDYFAAGASVLYGLYYTPIRVFRLDRGGHNTQSFLRLWTAICITAYMAHVAYLKYYSWNYTYNMAANVVCGVLQNLMWSYFSISQYIRTRKPWNLVPIGVVVWVTAAMSLELLDFPPLWGVFDAHSLWHAATVVPTLVFYRFLLQDAKADMASQRLKQ